MQNYIFNCLSVWNRTDIITKHPLCQKWFPTIHGQYFDAFFPVFDPERPCCAKVWSLVYKNYNYYLSENKCILVG